MTLHPWPHRALSLASQMLHPSRHRWHFFISHFTASLSLLSQIDSCFLLLLCEVTDVSVLTLSSPSDDGDINHDLLRQGYFQLSVQIGIFLWPEVQYYSLIIYK